MEHKLTPLICPKLKPAHCQGRTSEPDLCPGQDACAHAECKKRGLTFVRVDAGLLEELRRRARPPLRLLLCLASQQLALALQLLAALCLLALPASPEGAQGRGP